MRHLKKAFCIAVLGLFAAGSAYAATEQSKNTQDEAVKAINVKCVNCHLKENVSMVKQWQNSPHAAAKDGQAESRGRPDFVRVCA